MHTSSTHRESNIPIWFSWVCCYCCYLLYEYRRTHLKKNYLFAYSRVLNIVMHWTSVHMLLSLNWIELRLPSADPHAQMMQCQKPQRQTAFSGSNEMIFSQRSAIVLFFSLFRFNRSQRVFVFFIWCLAIVIFFDLLRHQVFSVVSPPPFFFGLIRRYNFDVNSTWDS